MHEISDWICASRFTYMCSASDAFLRKFPHITKLQLNSNFSPETLSRLTNLEILYVSNQEFPRIPFDKVHTLKVDGPSFPYDALSNLPRLTSLTTEFPPNIRYYPWFTSLRRLKIYSYVTFNDIEAISECTALTSLAVEVINIDVSPLSKLTNLRELLIRTSSVFQEQQRLIALLTKLPNLTSINILDEQHLSHLFPKLCSVEFSHQINPNCLVDMPSLTSLSDCADVPLSIATTLTNLRRLKDPNTNLYNCWLPTSLTSLSLSSTPSDDFRISRYTNLERLRISCRVPHQKEIASLTKLRSLKVYSYNEMLITDKHISSLTNLTELRYFEGAVDVSDPLLQSLPRLTFIKIENEEEEEIAW